MAKAALPSKYTRQLLFADVTEFEERGVRILL